MEIWKFYYQNTYRKGIMNIIIDASYTAIITLVLNLLLNRCFDKFYCIPINKLMNDFVDELNKIKDHSNGQIPDKIEIKEHSIFTILFILVSFIFLSKYFISKNYLAVIIGVTSGIISSIIHISASHALYSKIIMSVENIMEKILGYNKHNKTHINTNNFAAIYMCWIDKMAAIELFRAFLIAVLIAVVIFGIFLWSLWWFPPQVYFLSTMDIVLI